MKNLISALLIFLPFIGLSQYKPMNQPYQFNAQTKFADTVFLDTAMQGQGVFLVMDTLTGEVKRDTVSTAINGDSILTIVRANVDTSGTLNLQQVTDNDSTTDNKITITNSFEQGLGVTASGVFSHAEGLNTESNGLFSHAEGSGAVSSGQSSHAEGSSAVSSGQSSHAEGLNTESSGVYSHAEGNNTESSGNSSHAEGLNTESSGAYSHSEGANTEAFSYAEKSQGVFTTTYTPSSTTSIVSTDRIWAIGNGTGTSARNNALTMLKNGTTTIDTTWSYASDMTNYTFSGREIPHAKFIEDNFTLKTEVLQTDTFKFTSSEIIALGTGEDTLLTTTTGKFIDVISLSVVSIGGTGYTFTGDIVIKSENGTISTPATTILTSAGSLFRKSSIQDNADLGEYVIFDIQGSSATGGNKNLAIVVHYKIITL